MGTSKLSHKLIDLGFFSVLGTSERLTSEEYYVKRGQPNTHDYNNGILVVYDEEGRPWIIRDPKANYTIWRKLREFNLSQGAYVPHSNDGGHFIRKIEKL